MKHTSHTNDPLRHQKANSHLVSAFGGDKFGQLAEKFARFFGTPRFIIGQTIIVVIWIILNGLVVALRWDPYPFILLNLAFSTQAAYAAPLILLAQARQADRDKAQAEADALHREEIAEDHRKMLEQNTELTLEVKNLTDEVHKAVQVDK